MRKSSLWLMVLAAALVATFVWAAAASACPGCPYAESKEGCPHHAKKADKGAEDCPFATKEEAMKAGLDAPLAVGATTSCPMCGGGHEFEVKAKTQHIALEGKHFYFCSTHCAKKFQEKFGGEITTAGAE